MPHPARVAACVLLLASGFGCHREATSSAPLPTAPRLVRAVPPLHPVPIGAAIDGKPWIAHVTAVDLDRDGRMDVLACEAQRNQVLWLRQTASGSFEEIVVADGIPAPVHVEAVDIDGDGDLDLLVASMGVVFPNNEKIGSVIILENDGHQHFKKHVVAENIARVTDVRAGDFNGDGQLDLAVAQFGYVQGEVRWMENMGDWRFKSHVLLNLSGAINVLVADFDGNGKPDIAAVVSQEWEEIHLFHNQGEGHFTHELIYGSTNEDYGSSGITLCDLNHDGRPDILYTNGDGFDYAQPGPRPWHGVQWLENIDGHKFQYHRIGDLPGAYGPVAVDLNGDGAVDVVAVSAFNVWDDPRSVSLVAFLNDGRQNFTPQVLARLPTHLLTAAAADIDGTGQPVLITGGFHAYPPWDHMSRISLWRPELARPGPAGAKAPAAENLRP